MLAESRKPSTRKRKKTLKNGEHDHNLEPEMEYGSYEPRRIENSGRTTKRTPYRG